MNKYPYPSQPKEDNLLWGISAVQGFCDLNKIIPPELRTAANRRSNNYGYYTWGKSYIVVNVKKTRTSVKTPGFSWSYTGYKADLTTAGVIAHEFGHYLDCILGTPSRRLRAALGREPMVSSYEPNLCETFAEMIKLFILNPDLLRCGRPARYRYLTETLGLKPYITASWEEVLVNAHPKLISAARTWIAQGARYKK